jgi:colanic acid biosynthesis protein WcaH
MQPALTTEEFLAVVDKAPLVSIDLVVRDCQRRLLLGLRANDPARGFWFVPGGRIRKRETLDEAFARISVKELGVETPRACAQLLGVFTHQYDTNFAGAPQIDTHYVVIAYAVELALDLTALPRTQHSEYQWWTPSDAAMSEAVHPNNLPYFLFGSGDHVPSKSAV